jgi:NAD(P) transhydrogenase subunit alpha
MGASTLGGNVSGSRPGETVVTGNGITIIGADNLPASMPTAASNAFSRNVATLLEYLTADGALAIDTSDEIQAGVVITHDGRVVQEGVAALLAAQPDQAAAPGPAAPQQAAPQQAARESEGGADVDGLGD